MVEKQEAIELLKWLEDDLKKQFAWGVKQKSSQAPGKINSNAGACGKKKTEQKFR